MLKPLNCCLPLWSIAWCPVFEAGAEGVVVVVVAVGGGVVQQPGASAHPSLSTLHAVKQPREGQLDFRNDNGFTSSIGTRSKGPHLHPCGQISYQSSKQGHRELQSGDTPVTYCSVQSQQRHPLPQPPVLNIKAAHG